MEKILSISLMLNFTPNTLGCYGLIFFDFNYIFTLIKNLFNFWFKKNVCCTQIGGWSPGSQMKWGLSSGLGVYEYIVEVR